MENYDFHNDEAAYWSWRTKKAMEYLEYTKEMHQKAIKRLAEMALREQERNETEQEWLGNE